MLGVYARFDRALDGFQEICAVVLQVEPEQIVPQHSVKQFVLPGKCPEGLAIGPGYVPELSHREFWIIPLQHCRQKGQVIVLYENHGLLAVGLFQHRIGE